MMLVETMLKKSKIHGIGLFADENIKKGVVVYQPSPELDLRIEDKKFKKLNNNSQRTIKHYGYLDKNKNTWHLAFDDIRFCNHSKNANIAKLKNGDKLFAKRNIKKGEEILQDYEEFEELRRELK